MEGVFIITRSHNGVIIKPIQSIASVWAIASLTLIFLLVKKDKLRSPTLGNN